MQSRLLVWYNCKGITWSERTSCKFTSHITFKFLSVWTSCTEQWHDGSSWTTAENWKSPCFEWKIVLQNCTRNTQEWFFRALLFVLRWSTPVVSRVAKKIDCVLERWWQYHMCSISNNAFPSEDWFFYFLKQFCLSLSAWFWRVMRPPEMH